MYVFELLPKHSINIIHFVYYFFCNLICFLFFLHWGVVIKWMTCIREVAKRKSLFDDRSAEIQELTYIIKGDINSLNQQIAKLQEISKAHRKKTNAKHLLSHSSNMVVALQAKLASMSTDFKQVLEVRTENLKQQKSRNDQVRIARVIQYTQFKRTSF